MSDALKTQIRNELRATYATVTVDDAREPPRDGWPVMRRELGEPDLVVWLPSGVRCYLEVAGSLSEVQQLFGIMCRRLQCAYAIVRNADEAKEAIRFWSLSGRVA